MGASKEEPLASYAVKQYTAGSGTAGLFLGPADRRAFLSMEIFPQVLIAGSTGLVGTALVRQFAHQGVPVCALVRHTPKPGDSAFLWDPYHFAFREDMRRLSGIRAAIHLSGENLSTGRWTPEKKNLIRQSRITTTQAIVELLSHLEQPPEVFLCASAVGYYGHREDQVLTEQSAAGQGFLSEVCREWEAAAEQATPMGIRVVNLRFGVILSADGGALPKIAPVFRMGFGGNLSNGRQWMSWISLPDVLRVVDFCMARPEIRGPVNVVANPVSNREFTHALAHHLHSPAVLTVPAFALRAMLGEMAEAALLSSTRAIPEKLLQNGFIFEHPTLPQALNSVLPN